eukprot:204070_1
MGLEDQVTLRTKKFMRNPLLSRRQMVLEVIHQGLPNVSKADLQQLMAKRYHVKNAATVVLFGFRTDFGGGRSKGFALIYDSPEDLIKFEPNYRLIRAGLKEKVERSRKQIKELKNRKKKVRGTAKAKVGGGKK